MARIYYTDCKTTLQIKIIYVFKIHRDKTDGPITRVQCADYDYGNFFKNIRWINAEELAKSIYFDNIIAWGGTVNNSEKCFENVCKIIACRDGSHFYLSSVNDSNETNNLENFITD